MVPKGLKMLQAANQKKRADIDQFALDIYHQYGIGAKKFEQIRAIDEHTWNFSKNQEGYLAEIGFQGVPNEVLQRIRKSGGYAQLRVAELSAMRLGRRMENVYFNNWNTKFEIAGQ